MKSLLVLILITNIVIIWIFFIRGNVKFNIDREKDRVRAEMEIKADSPTETPDNEYALVTKSTIHISEIRAAVADMLPGMVRNEVHEALQEKDTEFDDDYKARHTPDTASTSRFTAVKDVNKAFEDNRTEGPAEGQEAAPAEDDESIPAFDELDRNLKTLKDGNATEQEKSNAVGAMLSVDGTNLVMSLPEPLHSNFINLIADYTAKQIDGEETKVSESKSEKPKPKPKPKKAKELPDSIDDFRISDYKK